MSEIVDRLVSEFEKSGLTYRQLKDATGIPLATLGRYFKNQTDKIKIGNIEKIAKALNVSAAYLMCWTDDPYYSIDDEAGKESPPVETDELKLLIDSLSEEKKKQLEQYAKFLLSQED